MTWTFEGSVVDHWQASCDVDEWGNDDTQAVKLTTYFKSLAWRFYTGAGKVTGYASADGQPMQNGNALAVETGHGETKRVWLSEATFYIAKGHSGRNAGIYTKVVSTSSYEPGTSEGWANVYIPPKTSYTVSYNANGGSGAPGNQTKWYNETLYASTQRPTRQFYTFLGWSSSPNGNVELQPGGAITGNANYTWYAIWKLALVPPTARIDSADRYDSVGGSINWAAGGYTKVVGTYSIDTKVTPGNKAASAVMSYKPRGASSWTDLKPAPVGSDPQEGYMVGDSDSLTGLTLTGWFKADIATTYDVQLAVIDTNGLSSTARAVLSNAMPAIEVGNEGKGVGILSTAPPVGVSIGGDVIVNGEPLAKEKGTNWGTSISFSMAKAQSMNFVLMIDSRIFGVWLYSESGIQAYNYEHHQQFNGTASLTFDTGIGLTCTITRSGYKEDVTISTSDNASIKAIF